MFKKICAACHKIGGEGNKIGPELDGIGLRGFDRILEDMLDPSRTVDQAFRSTQVLTKDGRTIVGLKLRTEGEVLILANNEGKEVRVPAAEIDKQGETKLSPMPANLADTLPPEEFYHLRQVPAFAAAAAGRDQDQGALSGADIPVCPVYQAGWKPARCERRDE